MSTIPPEIVSLCQDHTNSVSATVAADPTCPPGVAAQKLYKACQREKIAANDQPAAEPLAVAFSCGQWGSKRPSDLFLRAYHDALCTLKDDPLAGLVSPSLMGSCGTIPLTIIAPLEDIVRHMCNAIVRAQREVILCTCTWSPSNATNLITDALKELSRRVAPKGNRIAVKIMFARASAANFLKPYQVLSPEVYTSSHIQLPAPDDIPNLDLQVNTTHAPLLGTLHAKFMVVDRAVGIVESDNLEENSNLEMMTSLEGPIVDSLYDYALLTWNSALNPPLPTNIPHAVHSSSNSASGESISQPVSESNASDSIGAPPQLSENYSTALPQLQPGAAQYDDDIVGETRRIQSGYAPQHNEDRLAAINRQLNIYSKDKIPATGPEITAEDEFEPYILSSITENMPMALVSRRPYGPPINSDLEVPQNAAWLACIEHAKRSIFMQTPDLNAAPLYNALTDAVKRGVQVTYYVCLGYNDAGEMMPGQGGTNETFATRLTERLTDEERSRLLVHYYVAKDQDRPLSQRFKLRTCHIKLLIVDDEVAIQGSGNMDTQSWFHSQEINVMVDSKELCAAWRTGIERNQNTARFGRASVHDGVWRDADGKIAEGSTPYSTPPISWVRGAIGMVQKIKAKGSLG